jgi:hypothetical protein
MSIVPESLVSVSLSTPSRSTLLWKNRITRKLRMLPLVLIIVAALFTTVQMGTARAGAYECPGGGTATSKSYSKGCSSCVKWLEISAYWWEDWRWKCPDGSSGSYDKDGSCGSC